MLYMNDAKDLIVTHDLATVSLEGNQYSAAHINWMDMSMWRVRRDAKKTIATSTHYTESPARKKQYFAQTMHPMDL